MKLPTKVMATA